MTLRKIADFFRKTPMHPQWLMGSPHWLPNLAHHESNRVLDIGAADQWVKKRLPAGCQYIALDFPATGICLYHSHPNVFGDAATLPFSDDAFDMVICLEVIEHLQDPSAAFREISRVLKPQGQAIISMPFLYPIHDAPYDFQRFTLYGLRRELKSAGLKEIAIEKNGHAVLTGGLILTLALSGWATTRSGPSLVLLPICVLIILFVNLFCALLSRLLPDWESIGMGYCIQATVESRTE